MSWVLTCTFLVPGIIKINMTQLLPSWNLLLHSPWLQSSPCIQADVPAGKESSQGMGTFPSSQLSPQGAGAVPFLTDSFFFPLSYSITWTFYCPFRSLRSSALFSRYSVWVTPLGDVFFVFMWEGELPMLLLCHLYPVLCVGILKGYFWRISTHLWLPENI